VSFVPASDVEFKRLAAEFGKLAGVEVTVDMINMNDLNPGSLRPSRPRPARHHHDDQQLPHLYVDGSPMSKMWRRRSPSGTAATTTSAARSTWSTADGRPSPSPWQRRLELPGGLVQGGRREQIPDTWDELRKVGTALKKKNFPIGQAFGHSLAIPTAGPMR